MNGNTFQKLYATRSLRIWGCSVYFLVFLGKTIGNSNKKERNRTIDFEKTLDILFGVLYNVA